MTAVRLSTAAASDREPTVIDENHLGRMTLGDRRLEREVLELFLRQSTIMLDRILGAERPLAAALSPQNGGRPKRGRIVVSTMARPR